MVVFDRSGFKEQESKRRKIQHEDDIYTAGFEDGVDHRWAEAAQRYMPIGHTNK
jgi:hypothetical protein